MNKRITLLAVAGALACAFGLIALETVPSSPPQPTMQEALNISPSPLQMHFYPARREAAAGDRVKSSDVVTLEGKVTTSYVTYSDQSTEDDHFYSDGIHIQSSEDYFATAKGMQGRLLRGISQFERDGVTYKFHKVYRNPTGYLDRVGQRLRDGRYEQRYFFDDGSNIERIRYFDSGLNFSMEDVYRWKKAHDGVFVYAKILRADFSGQYWVSVYREDGTLAAVLKHSTAQEEGRIYSRDGNQLVAEYGRDFAGSRSYFLGYTSGGGEPTISWNSLLGRTVVTEVDPKTRLVMLQQVWKERPDPSVAGGKTYLLMTASKYDPESRTILKVDMSDNGSAASAVTVSDREGSTVKTLDASKVNLVDAFASKPRFREIDLNGAISIMVADDFQSDADEQYIKITRGLLKMPEHPQLVRFDDYGPAHLYDYR